jgi:hypothetical protein
LGIRAMKSSVNLELIFPIEDAPSASLMSLKANCLLDAGIITENEKQWVDARVFYVLAGDHRPFAPNRSALSKLSKAGSFTEGCSPDEDRLNKALAEIERVGAELRLEAAISKIDRVAEDLRKQRTGGPTTGRASG